MTRRTPYLILETDVAGNQVATIGSGIPYCCPIERGCSQKERTAIIVTPRRMAVRNQWDIDYDKAMALLDEYYPGVQG